MVLVTKKPWTQCPSLPSLPCCYSLGRDYGVVGRDKASLVQIDYFHSWVHHTHFMTPNFFTAWRKEGVGRKEGEEGGTLHQVLATWLLTDVAFLHAVWNDFSLFQSYSSVPAFFFWTMSLLYGIKIKVWLKKKNPYFLSEGKTGQLHERLAGLEDALSVVPPSPSPLLQIKIVELLRASGLGWRWNF